MVKKMIFVQYCPNDMSEVLHQVEGEAVVVVDDQQHRRNLRNSGGAATVAAAGTGRSAES